MVHTSDSEKISKEKAQVATKRAMGDVGLSASMWTHHTRRCARGLEFCDLVILFKLCATHRPSYPIGPTVYPRVCYV